MSAVLSGALFGGACAGTFYSVSRLFPAEANIVFTESSASGTEILTNLASTSDSAAQYGMDVSKVAAAALLSGGPLAMLWAMVSLSPPALSVH